MRHIGLYIPGILLFFASSAFAQQQSAASVPISFPDSVRIVLENTKNLDATVTGASFASAWAKFPPDQQVIIQRHVRMLKKKRFALRPHIVNYLAAVSNAITIDQASPQQIAGFLGVAGKVIENETPGRAQLFIKTSRIFFQHHALNYDKSFRLYARDDEYVFDYIEPAPTYEIGADYPSTAADDSTDSYQDTSSSDDWPESDSDSWPEYDTTSSAPADYFAEAPLWMNPPPPPIVEGPVIRFSRITLNFVTRYDSVFLKNSTGVFSFRDNLFVGEQGNFSWESAGLGQDVVDCELTVYHFKVTRPEFRSELAKLNYQGKTPGYIPGVFEYKSVARADSALSSYPRFQSFQSSLAIEGLADPNVKYTGGFSLFGNAISGASVNHDEAKVEIFHNGDRKFVGRSNEFIFKESSIISNQAKVTVFHGQDSIFHPRVRFKYSSSGDSIQRLIIRKDKGGMKHTPYSSSFFNIDFAADVIRWDLAADSMNLSIDGARNTVPLVIESVDYYDQEDYRLLKGQGFKFHPVALVANYCLRNNVREFYSGDLALSTGMEPRDIKAAIEFLSEKGLLFYDVKTDRVTVKNKLILLYQGARGESDYDNLKILSVIDSAANATINYRDGYMTVRGVDEFKVSDSLNVRITPDSSIVTLLQNRDIKFDGTINAGNFEISGKGFLLKYDSFYINLQHIDSINFYVMEKNSRGQMIRRKVNNSMVSADSSAAAIGGLGSPSSSSGTLYISKGGNKSGKEKIPQFPRLDASAGGVIYFDRPEVLSGAYDKSVFFVVPPFKLDSLNDADPSSINFDGTFNSSGIFPAFKEKLHTQPDKSLGFTHNIPQAGYRLYNGDGNVKGSLSMDNRGLRANGSIEYLAAKLNSSDFVFYPDSVLGRGELATIEEKQFGAVLFPQAKMVNYNMKWYPKQDRMELKNLNAPFEFYNSTAQMRGTVTISKEGVGGAGKFESRGTELVSRYMNFSGKEFGANHARLKVKSEDPEKPLLTGTNVSMRFNLEENYADVSPEVAGEAAIDFPYAQFKTSISRMRWDVDEQKITMEKDPNQPLEDSYFYTTRKDLDSLSFNAEKAVYDLKTQELKVSGIPYIIVADAMITPENNEVLILENAKIGTLTNTTIILDTLNAYHRLTEGVVDIKSRKEFSGHATYQYVNLLSDTFAIKMTDFHLEPISTEEKTRRSSKRVQTGATMQTVATGAVTDKDHLVLGAGMFYKGDMTMYSTRPALQLSGFLKLDIRNIKEPTAWIQYEQSGDETDILVDFEKAVTEEGDQVNAGLHFGQNDGELYITFLTKKKNIDDDDFFLPSGMLHYDTATSEFKIEDIEKARGNKLSGKVFAYNDEDTRVRFEGPVKLVRGTKGFDVSATAIGQGNMNTGEISMNSFLLLDCEVPAAALDLMGKRIQEVIQNEGADEGLGDPTELLYKIADLIGERPTQDFEQRSQQGYVSLGTIPQLAKPIAFSNVQLKWSPERKAFYSEGKIGISNILRNDINGAFEGYMEVRKNEDGGPVFHVFFKASPEAWYYFGFEDNRLLIHSSHDEFNTIIAKKTNAGKTKIGEVAFIPGSDDETLTFINQFRKNYLGNDVPYSLYESPPSMQRESPTPYVPAVIPTDNDRRKTEPEPADEGFGPVQNEEQPKKQKRQKRNKNQEQQDQEQEAQELPVVEPTKQDTPPADEDDGF